MAAQEAVLDSPSSLVACHSLLQRAVVAGRRELVNKERVQSLITQTRYGTLMTMDLIRVVPHCPPESMTPSRGGTCDLRHSRRIGDDLDGARLAREDVRRVAVLRDEVVERPVPDGARVELAVERRVHEPQQLDTALVGA